MNNTSKFVSKQIDSLISLLGDNCDQEDHIVLAMGSLATASYLLSNRLSYAGIPEDNSKPVNLIEQWSGPLPSAPPEPDGVISKKQKSKKPKITVDSHGRSGGEYGQYEVYRDVDSMTICAAPSCGAPIGELGSHPEDKNCKMENGKYPVIACDGSRVYTI